MFCLIAEMVDQTNRARFLPAQIETAVQMKDADCRHTCLSLMRPAQTGPMHIDVLPSPYRPDPKIASLGAKIGDAVQAADFPDTILRYRNDRWAATVGLDALSDAEWVQHFGRFDPPARQYA